MFASSLFLRETFSDRPARSRARRRSSRPSIELMEDRCVPATIFVTSLADGPGDAALVTPTAGGFNAPSLRAAISFANSNAGRQRHRPDDSGRVPDQPPERGGGGRGPEPDRRLRHPRQRRRPDDRQHERRCRHRQRRRPGPRLRHQSQPQLRHQQPDAEVHRDHAGLHDHRWLRVLPRVHRRQRCPGLGQQSRPMSAAAPSATASTPA